MRGTVTDRVTRAAVPGVLVSLWTPDDPVDPLVVGATDGRGAFDVDPGVRGREEPLVVRVHRTADGEVGLRDGGIVAVRADQLGAQLAVAAVPAQLRAPSAPLSLWVDDAFGLRRRYFGRLLDSGGVPLARTEVTVADLGGSPPQTVTTDLGGFVAVSYPGGDPASGARLRVWTRTAGGGALAADWTTSGAAGRTAGEDDVTLTDPGAFVLSGSVVVDGKGAAGMAVEVLDRGTGWPNPVAAATSDDGGRFRVPVPILLPSPPRPTVVVSSGGRQVAAVDVDRPWLDGRLTDVVVAVDGGVRHVRGTVLRRSTRTPVAGMRVELWVGDPLALTQVATTGAEGTFEVTLRRPGPDAAPPPAVLRAYAGTVPAVEQRIDDALLAADPVVVFLETDVVPPPDAVRISGRLVDATSRTPLPALRIEAWDRTPRQGGTLGVATYAAGDGSFELALPAGPPPALFFRVYAGDALVATLDGDVAWGEGGTATAVLAVTTSVRTTDEVVLHELGETIAGTVHRMQTELARYPSTMGAFLVDELDITVPVAVRLDGLGQVRTKVLEQAPSDGTVGQVRLRVRPVVGSPSAPTQPLVQPLSVLPGLDPAAVAVLEARRVYSVEDLARLAVTPAGRAALADLKLGVDLDGLLDTATLLATTVLPAAVRSLLVAHEVTSLRAFADADAAALAAMLTEGLGQPVAEADVAAWQGQVRDLLLVPLPTAEG